MTTKTIRPGLMVMLASSVRGGVSYKRIDLNADEATNAPEGAQVRKWETTSVIDDPAEHERAERVRKDASQLVRRCCTRTNFGMLCPESKAAELDAAIVKADAMVAEFNATSTTVKVAVFTMVGRVEADDVRAAKAIASEVRGMVTDMGQAIERLDVKAIREACDRARQMSAMLSEDQAKKVDDAIVQARRAARQIVKRVVDGGEDAKTVLLDLQRGSIEKARIAFLDLEAPAPAVAGEELPAVDVQRSASLDVDVDVEADTMQAPAPVAVPVDVSEEAEAAPPSSGPARSIEIDYEANEVEVQ